jgi:ribosomal protein S18 acetylase RimI-like enzyme
VLIVPDDAPMPPGPWPPPGWVLRASVPGRQLLGEGMAGPGPAPTTVAGPGEGMAGPGPAPTTVAGPGEGMAGPGEGMAGPGEGVAGPGPAPTTVGGHGGLLVSLGPADSAEMAELVERTRPGPFAARTVELGGYLGVRREGRLVAMAGWRLQLPGFVEISAVCTDPLERGRGLASRLVRAVAAAARRQGSIPFLHVAEANTGAIRLYESLGMRTVRTVRFCALQAR